MKIINPNSPLEFQIPTTGLVVAIDARQDPLEVENEFHYFNNPPTGGSLFSGMVGGETNPGRHLSESLFWRFGHRTFATSGSISEATDVGSLIKI